MELFDKKMINDLKPFQFKAFDFFQSESFLLCREKDIWSQQPPRVFWKSFINIFEKHPVIFISCRLGIYSFTKNEVIDRCSSKILQGNSLGVFFWLHPLLAALQTAIFKSIFCGTKNTLEWTTPYYALPTN